jgi:hypothetical protein
MKMGTKQPPVCKYFNRATSAICRVLSRYTAAPRTFGPCTLDFGPATSGQIRSIPTNSNLKKYLFSCGPAPTPLPPANPFQICVRLRSSAVKNLSQNKNYQTNPFVVCAQILCLSNLQAGGIISPRKTNPFSSPRKRYPLSHLFITVLIAFRAQTFIVRSIHAEQ